MPHPFKSIFSKARHARNPPMSRDSNLLSPDRSQLQDTQPAREPTVPKLCLTNIPVDVQYIVISLLDNVALSSLTKTCSLFLDLGSHELVKRFSDQRIGNLRDSTSFHKFLRVGGGPLSRAPLVRSLWLAFTSPRYQVDTQEHAEELFGILRSCSNLRRLRIDKWPNHFSKADLNNWAHTIATCAPSLEEVHIPISAHMDDRHLSQLMRLPLRRFVVSQSSDMSSSQQELLTRSLPQTVVELSRISIPRDLARRFEGVRELGVAMDRADPALVQNITTAFPNATRFKLWPTLEFSRDHRYDDDGSQWNLADEAAPRKHNQAKWQPDAWPALEAIWTSTMCDLYCLGLARHVRCVSLPLKGRTSFTSKIPAVLAALQSSFLELRVARPQSLELDAIAASASSVRQLVLHFTAVHIFFLLEDTKRVLDAVEQASGLQNMPLTHLLFRYATGDPSEEDDAGITINPVYSDYIPKLVTVERLSRVAQAFPTIRWIGREQHRGELRCWEVSRSVPGAAATLVAMGIQSGYDEKRAQQLDMFSNH